MLMPFVRLIAIYLVIGLAVFAFFERDALMALISGPEAEVATVEEPIVALVAEPVVTSPTPEPQPAPTPVAELVFVSADAAIPQTTRDTRLSEARQAYWDGDVVTAEFLYKNLSTDFPTEMNINGELGNLYYNSGRMTKAAEQYYAVGLLSLRIGNAAQSKAMIGVLRSTAPEMAADLIARAEQLN